MFKSTLKATTIRTAMQSTIPTLVFTKSMSGHRANICLAIHPLIMKAANFHPQERIDILVNDQETKAQIVKSGKGIKLSTPKLKNASRTAFASGVGRLYTDQRIVVEEIMTGEGVIEFKIPKGLYIKKLTPVQELLT